MKKKKIIITLALFLTAILFTACNNNDSPSGSPAKKEDSEVSQTESAEKGGGKLYTEIMDKGVIRIGTEGTYSPYSFHNEKDELVGYDVEIARAVAEKLGVEAEFVEAPWDSMLAAFDAGKSDVIFNQVAINEERQKKYDFTTPYTAVRPVLIIHEDNTEIASFEDLDGKSSAQTMTSNFAALAESFGAEIASTDGFSKSIELVITGRADATINDDVTFYDYKNQKKDAPIVIAATSEEIVYNAAAVKKGETELIEALDKALKELEDAGTIKEISEKYFGMDISQ